MADGASYFDIREFPLAGAESVADIERFPLAAGRLAGGARESRGRRQDGLD